MERREFDIHRLEVIDDATAAMFRAMSGAERLRVASGLFESAWNMTAAGVRLRHSGWSDEQVRREVAKRFLDAAD